MAMYPCLSLPSLSFPSVSGAVCSFDSQYAGLPLKSHSVAVTGYQSGSGTPSPSNPRALNGWSAIGISQNDGNYTTYADLTIPSSNTNAIDIATIPVLAGKTYTIYAEQDTQLTSSTRNTLYLSTPDGTVIENNTANYHNDMGCHVLTYDCMTNGNMTVRYWGHTPSTTLIISNIIISDSVFNNSIIQIGSTVYGGEYDARTGLFKVTHGFKLFDGSENWLQNGNAGVYVFVSIFTNNLDIYQRPETNIYQGVPRGSSPTTDYTANWNAPGTALQIRDSRGMTPSDFKQLLSQTNLQLKFALATPTTIQLPPCPIETQAGVNNVFADTGDTTLQYIKLG